MGTKYYFYEQLCSGCGGARSKYLIGTKNEYGTFYLNLRPEMHTESTLDWIRFCLTVPGEIRDETGSRVELWDFLEIMCGPHLTDPVVYVTEDTN